MMLTEASEWTQVEGADEERLQEFRMMPNMAGGVAFQQRAAR